MENNVKKWPAVYYASQKDCDNPKLRRCNPKMAKRAGVYGWRKWDANK